MDTDTEQILTDKKLIKIQDEIINLVNDDINVIEAITFYANKNNIEIEVLAEDIKRLPSLKALLQSDAETLHYIKPEINNSLF